MTRVAVLGAGAFGTALGVALARAGAKVALVARDLARARHLASARTNAAYLPGVPFPDPLSVHASLEGVTADVVLICVPMQTLATVLGAHARYLSGKRLVACCKGLDLETGMGPSALISDAVPDATAAVLSGPSFAADIGSGLPTALSLACRDREGGIHLQSALSTPAIRLYLTADVSGAELGGALKNVMAIAAGVTIGAGLGESARASVITRGFAEMQRVAHVLGGRSETLHGLSGFGDLVLTATSEKSRNYRAGLRLGAGEPIPEGTTVEGAATSTAMARIAHAKGIEAPLTQTVAKIINGDMSVAEAQADLLARPLKDE